VREEWIKNAIFKFKVFSEQPEKQRPNAFEMAELIFKKYRKFSDKSFRLFMSLREDPKAERPGSETFVSLFFKKSLSKNEAPRKI
jgi:hypothetical protein